jgi:hypothetical protein
MSQNEKGKKKVKKSGFFFVMLKNIFTFAQRFIKI